MCADVHYKQAALLRVADVAKLISASKSSIWSWVGQGKFPQPVRFGERYTAWRTEDIDAWIASRVREQAGERP